MKTIALAAVLTAAALPAAAHSAAASAAQQPDWNAVQITAEKVAGNVYVLMGTGGFAGGNVGASVGEDGIVLVDDKFQPLVPKIEAALRTVSDKPIRFVLNTHFHGDHTHGNVVYGQKSTVVAHHNVRKRMAADEYFEGTKGTRAPRHALPVVTFGDDLTIHVNGEEVRALHVPGGHTDGDAMVYFTTSKVLHMGDDFFNGMFPFIDLQSGGTVKGYIAASRKVLADFGDDVRIIPGHGPLASRADLAAWLQMLEETVAVVQKGIDAGRTLEQMQADKVLAKWDRYSWDFISTDKHLAQLYNGLRGIATNP